ncbi:hypothetical protein KC725_01810 [Candidatus Peregrinibacteria bacterium]|nr:hypothetical protein [Candidatus Peregrinibacteria bacterium]
MKKLILIDGNAIFHRAYHSLPPFKTSKGETTNAIYGFVRMLIELYMNEQPDYLGIAWDRKAPTFRKKMFDDYKATRSAPPEDLYPQLPRLKEIVEAFRIPQLEKDGFEADDLLGTAAHKAEQEEGVDITILTGDQDAFQLVSPKTTVMTPIKGVTQVKRYQAAEVEEKFGVRPDQIIDYKAISGDTSDNIPGVPGIGPKGASELLQKYGDLDNIYDHLDELKPGHKSKLEDNREIAYMSQKLATIHCDAPLEFNLADYSVHDIDYPTVEKLFDELEFNSLTRKLDQLKDTIRPEAQQALF